MSQSMWTQIKWYASSHHICFSLLKWKFTHSVTWITSYAIWMLHGTYMPYENMALSVLRKYNIYYTYTHL